MEEHDSFWTPEVTENFRFVKHNDTDYESFKDFSKGIDERFASIEARREKAERIAALDKWDRELPDRWREAKLNLIKKPVVEKILKALEVNPRGSFFLKGASGAGKTFVAYALVRRLIGKGIATPSQIKMISESVLLNWASRGFKGADMLEQLLNERYKLYIFDGIGTLSDSEAEKVAPLWEQILDHIYSRDLIGIFTSSDDLDRFAETLSPSGETKLRTLVRGRDLVVEADGSKAVKG